MQRLYSKRETKALGTINWENVIKRLRDAIQHTGLKKKVVAEKCDVVLQRRRAEGWIESKQKRRAKKFTAQILSDILAGKNENHDYLPILAEVLSITEDWLIYGNGQLGAEGLSVVEDVLGEQFSFAVELNADQILHILFANELMDLGKSDLAYRIYGSIFADSCRSRFGDGKAFAKSIKCSIDMKKLDQRFIDLLFEVEMGFNQELANFFSGKLSEWISGLSTASKGLSDE